MEKDRLYVNADVITMNPKDMAADSFSVRHGLFDHVGSGETIDSKLSSKVEAVDLKGKTVVPGFIETHNHLMVYALTLVMLDCSPRANNSIKDIQDKIKDTAKEAGPGQWVIGWGYDDTMIEEKRHLHKNDLDAAAPENLVLIFHSSGHLSYAGTGALKLADIDRNTKQPEGGTIHKDENGEPTGLLMEPAAQLLVAQHLPSSDASIYKFLFPEAIAHYNKEGVTSTHDAGIGMQGKAMDVIRAYRDLENENNLNIRVYLTCVHPVYDQLIDLGLGRGFGTDSVKLGSVKLFQDGSIQALTAALTKGYYNAPEVCGELIIPQNELERLVEKYHKEGLQIAVHANGDAAIESVVTAMEKARAKYPEHEPRHMIIHCQTATDDQLKRMKAQGIIPSFFPGHVYFWGDRHQSIFLGPERAARINPLASSVRAGLRFTLHADTPVTPVSPLFSMHCAVNRVTRDGLLLGPDERITPLDALKTFTTDAAFCSYEENIKGSIQQGKLADFVVLSDNPLTCDPKKIKDIQVLKTFVGGKEVYTAKM